MRQDVLFVLCQRFGIVQPPFLPVRCVVAMFTETSVFAQAVRAVSNPAVRPNHYIWKCPLQVKLGGWAVGNLDLIFTVECL